MPKLTGFARTPIPGPTRTFGHFPPLFRFLDDPHPTLASLRAHGDVVALARDNPALVFVFGPAKNREVLSNPGSFIHNEDFIRGKPGTPLGLMTRVIVNINGADHKRHRRLMMPAFAKSALDGYAEEIVRLSEELVARWPVGEVANLDVLLRDLAQAVALKTLLGVDRREGEDSINATVTEFIDALAAPLSILLPWDLPGLPHRVAQRSGGELLTYLERLIETKRDRAEPDNDALAHLMHAVDEEGSQFTDDELLAETVTLFFAGHDTMARTMSWTMFLLDRHPEVLADLLDEIDGVLGGRSVTVADIPRLPLLDRVINESMRVLSTVPILFLRVLTDGRSVGDVELPKHANLVVSPHMTHRDPDLYPGPRRFDPGRWEGFEPSIYEYLPFGAGPRLCIGATFARQALRLMLATVLQRVRVAIVRGADVSRITRANIMRPRHGLPARVDAPHRRKLTPEPIRGDIRDLVELA